MDAAELRALAESALAEPNRDNILYDEDGAGGCSTHVEEWVKHAQTREPELARAVIALLEENAKLRAYAHEACVEIRERLRAAGVEDIDEAAQALWEPPSSDAAAKLTEFIAAVDGPISSIHPQDLMDRHRDLWARLRENAERESPEPPPAGP
jgi:hypothetical protein